MHPQIRIFCRRLSKSHHKVRRKTLLRGISAVALSAATGGIFFYYQSTNLHEALGIVSQSDAIEREKASQKGGYIYVSSEEEDSNKSSNHEQKSEHSKNYLKYRERNRLWFSWLQSCSHDPQTLLRLAQSDQHSVRLLGVQALASQQHWHDAQYLSVAQACDKRTLIGLARSRGVDSRFFLGPPPLPNDVDVLEDQLRRLLGSLPTTGIDKCTNYFTSHALAEGKIPSEERGGMWCFGGNGLAFAQSLGKVPDEYVELFCLQAITRHSSDSVWSFDGNGLMRLVPSMSESTSSRVISFCLHALFAHSKVSSHCPEIVKNNGLQVLQRIYVKRGESIKVCRNIARIISNIALHEDMHTDVVNAGWVTILSKWLSSPDIALSMLAGKALANLDLDFGGGNYEDGVHLYYPQHRFREPVYADVVFVHGLLGGPFRTWRQRDPDPPSSQVKEKAPDKYIVTPENIHQSSNDQTGGKDTSHGQISAEHKASSSAEHDAEDERTACWPKDWLAKDYPHMRLLTLEYDTHLSEWAPKCPFGSEKRSLAVRSAETLRKLKEAGLGKRPIIWVGHSMGGLIIKNVLVSASKDPAFKDIVDKSKGIVFYSVPHRGSPLAARSAQAKYLLYPSVEVEELTHGSEMLINLHKSFTELMFETGIPLLSFGEGKKSDLPFNFKLMIVPPESSNPGFGEYHLMEEHNHLDICKPNSKRSQLYKLTLEFICDCIPQNLVDNILRANMMPDDFIFSEFMN